MRDAMNPWRCFEVGLVTIEMETAFIVGAAEGDNLFDAVFTVDANGLPCIPGESLAGVLRHALAGEEDPRHAEACRQVFGFQDRSDGDASRVRISFAHVHGQDDRPVAFRGAKSDDPVLAALQAGVGRDHVRIGMHGAVDKRGKFDELLVPAGARFTFELCVSADSGCGLSDLVAILARPELRLGGKSRRGLGRFRVVRVRSARFDLTSLSDLQRLSNLPVALHEAAVSKELKAVEVPSSSAAGGLHGEILLKPIGTWMVGGGIPNGREPERRDGKAWDRVPLSERRIVWTRQAEADRGRVIADAEAPYLVPGSSVKGALRHRTAFHARRLRQLWLEDGDEAAPEESYLFGEVRDSRSQAGLPGRVFLSDVYLSTPPPLETLQHVSLDRFTQGPMDHLLYDELCLGACELKLDVFLRLPEDGSEDGLARRALQAALDDLCAGRLSIGAGRGHGRFSGTVRWRDDKRLVKEDAVTC